MSSELAFLQEVVEGSGLFDCLVPVNCRVIRGCRSQFLRMIQVVGRQAGLCGDMGLSSQRRRGSVEVMGSLDETY